MKKLFVAIGFLLLVSYQNKADNTTKNVNELNSSMKIFNVQTSDTISTKEFANKVLKGLAKVSDDDVTFACMDSLTSNDTKTRDFYWSVFKIILVKSDGALSEAVGSYLIAYLQKYPKEFTKRYTQLNEDLKGKCVHFVSFEYYASNEGDTEVQTLKDVCKNCSSKEKNAMIKFAKEVLMEVEGIRKQD